MIIEKDLEILAERDRCSHHHYQLQNGLCYLCGKQLYVTPKKNFQKHHLNDRFYGKIRPRKGEKRLACLGCHPLKTREQRANKP